MVRTTIMAEEELLYKIDQIARRQGKSKAAVIREALVEYVTVTEAEEPFVNPLLGLIGLAGDEGEEMDLSDGKDEAILREEWNKRYEERLS
ncbi:MAG: CopG family transcriptional regulator [Anaerolineales bacterium]|nr:CopG family transcriptional regulator [Anaerolineales bacterium]